MGLTRRLFLGGMLAGTAAPAIVRASSLMPIWVPKQDLELSVADLCRLKTARMRQLLDEAELACNPPLIVDYGRPGGDMQAWARVRIHQGNVHFELLQLHEIYKPWR